MLVLTRKKGESILIGDGVEVRLLGLTAKEARIGISAPRGLAVDRREYREQLIAKEALQDEAVEVVAEKGTTHEAS